jgi:tetratricopeptide (TPR) repeat protein
LTAGLPTYPYKGGKNSIWGNTNFDAQAYQSGTIIACRNWWGSDGIQTDVFSGGYINSSLPLTSDPWAGGPPPMSNPITNNTGDGDSELLNPENPDDSFAEIYTGITLETEGRINDAVNHYKQMINNDLHPRFAFSSLARIKNRFSREDIEVYFNSLSSENNLRGELKLIAANLLASMLLDKGNYTGAINIYDRIINLSPTSYYGITAMFEKYFAALNYKKDRELAASLLGEIQSLPYDDEDFLIRKEMAEFLLYGFQESDNKFGKPLGSSDNNSIEIPKEFSLLGNYPNPFNPTTNISYSLPFASSVDLTIYDIMGREIKSFVFSSQSSGIQNIIWDGRNSNGENVSSGIYLYRIRLQSLENNESFEKTAKLIMMK